MRRALGLAAAAAAAVAFVLPAAPANAYLCYAQVGDICVGPCEIANTVSRATGGGDILYC
jgi:hypothetical protein